MSFLENHFDSKFAWRIPDERKYLFVILSLLIFLLIIYWYSFQGTWILDDMPNIVENPHVQIKTLDWDSIQGTFRGIDGRNINRPFAYLTFALNHLFHRLDVFGYHIVNFFIHFATSFFLFCFIYRMLRLPLLEQHFDEGKAYAVALLSMFFWAVNPMQVTAVTYIVQRMSSMAGLFYILSMYFYLRGRTSSELRNKVALFVLCVLSGILALASKENAVLIPFSILLFDLLLIQGVTRESITRTAKWLVIPVVLFICTILLFAIDLSSLLKGFEGRPFTLTERLMTEPRVILFYITLLLYPLSSRLMLLHDVELSTSLLAPWTTIPSILIIAGVIFYAIYIARKNPLISFCILFFFLNHAVEGSFLPLELVFEHRNYIPSFFFFIPIALLYFACLNLFKAHKRMYLLIFITFTFIVAAIAHTTYIRNEIFMSPVTFWEDNVRKTPKLARALTHLGKSYAMAGLSDKAEAAFMEAYSREGHLNFFNHFDTRHNLAVLNLYRHKNYTKAAELYRKALAIYDSHPPAWKGLALALLGMGSLKESEDVLRSALERWPQNAELHSTLGLVFLKTGKYENAIAESLEALRIDLNEVNAYKVLGAAYMHTKDYGKAQSSMEKYVSSYFKSTDLEANLALVEIYHALGRNADLDYTVGKLMFLKKTKDWHDLLETYVNNSHTKAYVPDPSHMKKIFNSSLQRQEKHLIFH